MKDKRSAYDAASKSSFEQQICGSQSQSQSQNQLIGSGLTKKLDWITTHWCVMG